jgi:hypothetical protein
MLSVTARSNGFYERDVLPWLRREGIQVDVSAGHRMVGSLARRHDLS